ncbi:dihydroneopterin aldolase [Orbaceae bacterium ESL0721]|nr:dihydroneopterin aldolase [Orbaceae bacterium ESL0721]
MTVPTDRVFIEGLTVITTIGVYDFEQEIKQKLVIDLEMAWNNQPAGSSDDVDLCLDYFKVSQAITHYVEANSFGLIERVAEEVANLVIDQFQVSWLTVKVSKPTAVVNANSVAVKIERHQSVSNKRA